MITGIQYSKWGPLVGSLCCAFETPSCFYSPWLTATQACESSLQIIFQCVCHKSNTETQGVYKNRGIALILRNPSGKDRKWANNVSEWDGRGLRKWSNRRLDLPLHWKGTFKLNLEWQRQMKRLPGSRVGLVLSRNKGSWATGIWANLYFQSSLLLGPWSSDFLVSVTCSRWLLSLMSLGSFHILK